MNLLKACLTCEGKNKVIKQRLDRPVQVKKATKPTTVETDEQLTVSGYNTRSKAQSKPKDGMNKVYTGEQLTVSGYNTRSKAEPKPKDGMNKVYTGPQTRSRTQAAIEAELEQERKVSSVPGAFPSQFTCESHGN